MQRFGLNYGAMDVIVTPDGRYVFLEINPAGQYMWIESKLGLPITDALVELLSEPLG
jgi:glutathione synthase/RimK-type ligase-like ATP-grasp enzyme